MEQQRLLSRRQAWEYTTFTKRTIAILMTRKSTTGLIRPRRQFAIAVLWLILAAPYLPGQTVTWGINGVGGSGTWNTTSNNWFNGTSNVTWPAAGNAIFGGAAGGTVSIAGPFVYPEVSSMTFNTPGYVIQGSWIYFGSNGLTVNTNVDATIGFTTLRTTSFAETLLVKNGPAAMILSSSGFLDKLQVNQGEVRLTNSALSFTDVSLANAPSVSVTLAASNNFAMMGTLSGGGTAGGIVQPSNEPRIMGLSSGGGIFDGVLQDNGSGILAFSTFGSGTQFLTNTNSYSGPTNVSTGQLVLAAQGSVLNSPVTSHGKLVLDNSATVVTNRVSDSLPFNLGGGSIALVGNDTTPVEEFLGPLILTGASRIEVVQPAAATAQLTFGELQRNGHATLVVDGPGVKIDGLTNGPTGILSPFVTTGNDWATIGGDGRIASFSDYSSDPNAGPIADHVKLSGGSTTLTSDTTKATLNLTNANASANQVLDLAGHNLDLIAGGILSSGAGANSIQSGSLSASTTQLLFVTSNNQLAIGSAIIDGAGATALVKAGPGALTLTGTNTYSGPTVIAGGTLVVASDANLGLGSTIELSGGTLKAESDFQSSKDFPTTSVGTIDTASFHVTLSGEMDGRLVKSGQGTLTITDPSFRSAVVNQGILELANTTSGSVTLSNGTLRVAGTLSGLSSVGSEFFFPPSTLDIGGIAPATLTTGTFSQSFSSRLQILFGVGSDNSDFWVISTPRSFSSTSEGAFQFAFHDLGGVATGVDYPLMSFVSVFGGPSPNLFAFAPGMAEAGWAGTFSSTSTGLSVRFSSVPVPEPRLTLLLLLQGAVLVWASRRIAKSKIVV